HQGRPADAEKEHYAVVEAVNQRGNDEHKAWALIIPARILLRRGHIEEAMDLARQARDLVERYVDRRTGIPLGGIFAPAWLRSGNLVKAEQAADETADLLAKIPVGDLGAFPGHIGITEVYLAG